MQHCGKQSFLKLVANQYLNAFSLHKHFFLCAIVRKWVLWDLKNHCRLFNIDILITTIIVLKLLYVFFCLQDPINGIIIFPDEIPCQEMSLFYYFTNIGEANLGMSTLEN